MANPLIYDFLSKKGIFSKEEKERLVSVVKLVAEIPWGEGRSIEDVLVTKKVGTCTGKHLVLQACLDELNIPYKTVVCTFRWNEQPIKFPADIQKILREGSWEHGHNFVQIKGLDGKTIEIDITWNSKLKNYGFKTFPADWDGKTAFMGVNKIIRRWDGVKIEDMKKELIESLPLSTRERRERFLKHFIIWVNTINN